MDSREILEGALLKGIHAQCAQELLWENTPRRQVRDLHPAPWSVRQEVDPRFRDILYRTVYDYIVVDANGRTVCETQDAYVAHAIAASAQTVGEFPPQR